METREQVEQLFWEVLDGTATPTDSGRAELLRETSPEWAELYDELKTLHLMLDGAAEPDQPSMRFTQNVLDMIREAKPASPVKQLSPWVLRIAVSVLGIVLAATAWIFFQTSGASSAPDSRHVDMLSDFRFDRFTSFGLAAAIMAGWMLIDAWLRFRQTSGARSNH
jgi:hypothetical protein